MATTLAKVTGFSKGTSTRLGILVTVGSPLTMLKITVSSTPAVPRSNRLRVNLVKAEVAVPTLCPGSNPTKDPAATWL